MTIYHIANPIAIKADYVSDDQAIVDANTANPVINSIVFGDAAAVDTILTTNKAMYLENQAFRLNANKTVITGLSTVLVGVNYLTEEANTTETYNVFNDLTGTYTSVVGTDELNTTIQAYQTQLLTAAGLSQVSIITEIPQPRKTQPATTGTQTL